MEKGSESEIGDIGNVCLEHVLQSIKISVSAGDFSTPHTSSRFIHAAATSPVQSAQSCVPWYPGHHPFCFVWDNNN